MGLISMGVARLSQKSRKQISFLVERYCSKAGDACAKWGDLLVTLSKNQAAHLADVRPRRKRSAI